MAGSLALARAARRSLAQSAKAFWAGSKPSFAQANWSRWKATSRDTTK